MDILGLQKTVGQGRSGEFVLSKDDCKHIYEFFKTKEKERFGAINIILKYEEDTPDVAFVEIENDKGESIDIGESSSYEEFTKLRILASDIFNHNSI